MSAIYRAMDEIRHENIKCSFVLGDILNFVCCSVLHIQCVLTALLSATSGQSAGFIARPFCRGSAFAPKQKYFNFQPRRPLPLSSWSSYKWELTTTFVHIGRFSTASVTGTSLMTRLFQFEMNMKWQASNGHRYKSLAHTVALINVWQPLSTLLRKSQHDVYENHIIIYVINYNSRKSFVLDISYRLILILEQVSAS